MAKRVAIITFHGSHNYGSVLQAYATQRAIDSCGCDASIIDFRFKEQKQFYSQLQIGYGNMITARNCMLFPFAFQRRTRAKKFNNFISGKMKLTKQSFSTFDELKNHEWTFDVFVSGGDQLWSPHVPEVAKAGKSVEAVYYLSFVDNVRKISYGTSIGDASEEDIMEHQNELMLYDHISTREERGKAVLQDVTNKDVTLVCDPVFLLSSREWMAITAPKSQKKPYILLYTLQGVRSGLVYGKILSEYAEKLGMDLICIAPFFPVIGKNVRNILSTGPEEFLSLIANASLVCTDSFHGTAFSIVFRKPFYSIRRRGNSEDCRKQDLLNRLGLDDRLLGKVEDIQNIEDFSIDYNGTEAEDKLKELINDSWEYLQQALKAAIKKQ